MISHSRSGAGSESPKECVACLDLGSTLRVFLKVADALVQYGERAESLISGRRERGNDEEVHY